MCSFEKVGEAAERRAGGARHIQGTPTGPVEIGATPATEVPVDQMVPWTARPATSSLPAPWLPNQLWEGIFDQTRYEGLAIARRVCRGFSAMARDAHTRRQTHLRENITKAASPEAVIQTLQEAYQRGVLQGTQRLDLSGKQLEAEHMESLCGILTHAGGPLTRLNLQNNAFEVDGVKTLAATPLPELKDLDLGFNDLGTCKESGLAALAEAKWPKLESLSLACNGIQDNDSGLTSFAQWTKRSALRHLDLGSNDIGQTGATALVRGLKEVARLSLRGNNIDDAGAQALVAAEGPK